MNKKNVLRVPAGGLTGLASEGRLTLQIQELELVFPGDTPSPFVEVQPEHYVRLSGGKLAPRGFPHFTRAGFEFYKDQLRAAFRNTRGSTWENFEVHAEEHFAGLEASIKKEIKKHEKAIARLRSVQV